MTKAADRLLDPTVPAKGSLSLSFDDHPITVFHDKAGSPWWVADEVCAVLQISNPRSSLALLDDDEKGVHTVDTLRGGAQRKATINESGLYALIFRSRKPEAKRFKRWVTHEVLPAIRRTGSYSLPDPAMKERMIAIEQWSRRAPRQLGVALSSVGRGKAVVGRVDRDGIVHLAAGVGEPIGLLDVEPSGESALGDGVGMQIATVSAGLPWTRWSIVRSLSWSDLPDFKPGSLVLAETTPVADLMTCRRYNGTNRYVLGLDHEVVAAVTGEVRRFA